MDRLDETAALLGGPVRICDDCGCRYADWWADEELWATVIGRYEGSLCFDCFRVRCGLTGIVTVVWNATAHYNLPGSKPTSAKGAL